MYCKKCGQELKGNSKFCPQCGEKVDVDLAKIKASEKSIRSKKLLIGILAIIICIGFVISFKLKMDLSKKADYDNYLAWVAKEGEKGETLYGYINAEGEEVIPCKYNSVSEFSENGLAWVRTEENESYCIKKNGQTIMKSQYFYEDVFSNGLCAVTDKVKFLDGYINEEGEEVIPCQYYAAGNFAENGLAYVCKEENGKYGYINTKGEEVIPCKYNEPSDFQEDGYAFVSQEGVDYKFYINEKGEMVENTDYEKLQKELSRRYDFVGSLKNGFIVVGLKTDIVEEDKDTYKYGYVNENGIEIAPCQYDTAYNFSNSGLACVGKKVGQDEYEYKYINTKGKIIMELPEKYIFAGSFVKVN